MSKAIQELNDIKYKRRLTQIELADLLNVTQGYLSMVLSGKTVPSDKVKQTIEDRVGIKKIDWYK